MGVSEGQPGCRTGPGSLESSMHARDLHLSIFHPKELWESISVCWQLLDLCIRRMRYRGRCCKANPKGHPKDGLHWVNLPAWCCLVPCCIGSAIAQLYSIPCCVLPHGHEGIPSSYNPIILLRTRWRWELQSPLWAVGPEEIQQNEPVPQRRDKRAASCLPRAFLGERGKMSDFKGKNPREKLPGCFFFFLFFFWLFFSSFALLLCVAVRRTRSPAPARGWSRLYINSQPDVACGLGSDRSALKLENASGRGCPLGMVPECS